MLLALGIGWLIDAPSVHAERDKLVLVLAPNSDDPALIEVSARVRGELAAAGFKVFTREPPPGVSPLRAVEHAGVDLSPSAVLWIVAATSHSQTTPNMEIWLSDRLLGRVSMARLTSVAGRAETPSSLAVQAVELLRARLSELRVKPLDAGAHDEGEASWVDQRTQLEVARPAVEPREVQPTARTRRPFAWGVGAGLVVLWGSGSLDTGLMPGLSLVWGVAEPRTGDVPLAVDLRLSAAGFGQRQELHRDAGSARVAQGLGELSAALRWVTGVPIEPSISLGAGTYALGVHGSAATPYAAHDERFWSALGSVGLGLRTRPWAHLSLSAVAELVGTLTRVRVSIADDQAALAGGGMWLLRAELTGVF